MALRDLIGGSSERPLLMDFASLVSFVVKRDGDRPSYWEGGEAKFRR